MAVQAPKHSTHVSQAGLAKDARALNGHQPTANASGDHRDSGLQARHAVWKLRVTLGVEWIPPRLPDRHVLKGVTRHGQQPETQGRTAAWCPGHPNHPTVM